MSSTAFSDPQHDGASSGRLPNETAPSLMRDDDLFLPRLVGVFAAAAVIFGATAILLFRSGRGSAVGPGWASVILSFGLIGLLFHAAFDRDIQFRRVYMMFGYLALGLGGFLCILPYPTRPADQFGPGFMCMSLGLMFLLCFLRHETDEKMRNTASLVFGGAGVLMAVFGLFGGLLKGDLLIGNKDTFVAAPVGLLLAMLGLVFLIACVVIRGTSDEIGYRIGMGMGFAGSIVFFFAARASAWWLGLLITGLLAGYYVYLYLVRRYYPDSAHEEDDRFLLSLRIGRFLIFVLAVAVPGQMWFASKYTSYFMPFGLLLQILGIVYTLTSLLLCSDRPLFVLIRREFGAFFYSPIAHLVLFSFVFAHWFSYLPFMMRLVSVKMMPEPIVIGFILQWASVIWTIFAVPALTMRLISPEYSGTLEQLLTAPVDEWVVVLSKFFAAFVMFILIWLPLGFLMVYLRMEGGTPFDYRPLFSFGVGLFLTGAAFVSIGLLFSSLTSNQIIAGVLTFGVMLILTLMFLAEGILSQDDILGPDSNWVKLMRHVSYIHVWIETLQGKLIPKYLLFPASVTVFCLFVTTKVLESRKWK